MGPRRIEALCAYSLWPILLRLRPTFYFFLFYGWPTTTTLLMNLRFIGRGHPRERNESERRLMPQSLSYEWPPTIWPFTETEEDVVQRLDNECVRSIHANATHIGPSLWLSSYNKFLIMCGRILLRPHIINRNLFFFTIFGRLLRGNAQR